eukprot:439250_1
MQKMLNILFWIIILLNLGNSVETIVPSAVARSYFEPVIEYESKRKVAVTGIADGELENTKNVLADIATVYTGSMDGLKQMFGEYFGGANDNEGFKYFNSDTKQFIYKPRIVIPNNVEFYILACGSVARRELTAASDLDVMFVTFQTQQKTETMQQVQNEAVTETMAYWEALAKKSGHDFAGIRGGSHHHIPGLEMDPTPGLIRKKTKHEFYEHIAASALTFGNFIDSALIYESANADYDLLYDGFIDYLMDRDIKENFDQFYDLFCNNLLTEQALVSGNNFSPKQKVIRPLTVPIMAYYVLRYKHKLKPIVKKWTTGPFFNKKHHQQIIHPPRPYFSKSTADRLLQLVDWGDLDQTKVNEIIPYIYYGIAKELQYNILNVQNGVGKLYHGRVKQLSNDDQAGQTEITKANAAIAKVKTFITHYKSKYDSV